MNTGPLSVEVIPFALRFRQPYVTATGSLTRRESVLLRIRDENGIVALGEGVPMSLRGGDPIGRVVAELETWAENRDLLPDSPPARCAVSIALADLESTRRGIPLWRLLAPDAEPEALKCNATIVAGPVETVVTQCEEWAESGFDVFKLKAGPREAVELATQVRTAMGPEAKIRLDANGSWHDAAPAILRSLEPIGVELVEEPVSGLPELAALNRRTNIPLVADESVNDRTQAELAAAEQACAAATVKLTKIGGLDVSLGGVLPTYLSSALDGPVGIAAAAHAAQSLPTDRPWPSMAHGLATEKLFAETICTEGPLLSGDLLEPPGHRHGLGIDLDDDALDRCRLNR